MANTPTPPHGVITAFDRRHVLWDLATKEAIGTLGAAVVKELGALGDLQVFGRHLEKKGRFLLILISTRDSTTAAGPCSKTCGAGT